MDESTELLIVVTPARLKTIQACAVVRQARMREVARKASDDGTWEIHDAAIREGDKSYDLGYWASGLLGSLSPERIEDEWVTGPRSRLMRLREWEDEQEASGILAGHPATGSTG